jgi:hypothetical protein
MEIYNGKKWGLLTITSLHLKAVNIESYGAILYLVSDMSKIRSPNITVAVMLCGSLKQSPMSSICWIRAGGPQSLLSIHLHPDSLEISEVLRAMWKSHSETKGPLPACNHAGI